MERETDDLSRLAGRAEEHRQLAGFIERYSAAARQGDAGQLILLLEQVSDYARSHHQEEERLMAFFGYPSLQAHRDAHRRLAALIAELLFKLRASEAPAVAQTETMLRGWFNQHLRGPDADLHAFLAERFGNAQKK